MVFEHLEEKEAVKRAALIETNGYRFYTLLADRVDDVETKKVLLRLADDEKKHQRLIENKFFPEAGFSPEEITDEELVIEEYIERSGAADIFSRRIDVEALVRVMDTTKKALILALDTERNSVDYFLALARKAESAEARAIYEDLVDEERRHVALIEGLLAALPPSA
ncbi:MAG: ferritin family protein [Thermodesulfobacteriota bacterium]